MKQLPKSIRVGDNVYRLAQEGWKEKLLEIGNLLQKAGGIAGDAWQRLDDVEGMDLPPEVKKAIADVDSKVDKMGDELASLGFKLQDAVKGGEKK